MRTVPDFTLKQLSYLRALAAAGSFSAAARKANISQPAISLQIQSLEQHFGGQLIERRRGGVTLTPLGQEVLEKSGTILELAGDLSALAVKAKDEPPAPVRLGLIPTVAPYMLPAILPALKRDFPKTQFAIREGKTSALLDDLAANGIDAAIVALPAGGREIGFRSLFHEPFLLAADRNFAPGGTGGVAVSEIRKNEVLLLEEGHCLRDQAIQACGIDVNEAVNQFGATSLSTIVEMVASGYGVTLLPEMSLKKEAADKRIALYPIAEPCPSREVGIIWRASSPFADFYNRLADTLASTRTDGGRQGN